MIMKSGVYQILNLVTGKRYIGSSKNIVKRFNAHKNSSEIRKHSNTHLMNSFRKYGLENFQLSVIEECGVDILFEREQYWVDFYGIENLYNQRKFVNTNVGVKWTEDRKIKWKQRVISDETRAKISKNSPGNKQPRTQKQLDAISNANKGRPSWNTGTKGVMKPNDTSFKKGIAPWNKNNPNAWRGPSKQFQLVSPENILYVGLGVKAFAKEIGMTEMYFNRIINNKQPLIDSKRKKWRLPKEGDIYTGYGFFGEAA